MSRLTARRRIRCVALGALGLLVTPTLLHAETTATLDYRIALSGCPERDQFERWVASRLGREAFTDAAQVQVIVEASRTKEELVVSLRITRASTMTERSFKGGADECSPLVEAAASATSVALDSLVVPPSKPPPPAAPAPIPSAERMDKPKVAPQRPARTPVAQPNPIQWQLEGQAVGSFGLSPSPTAGGVVGAGLRTRRMSFGLRVNWQRSVTDTTVGSADQGDFEVLTGDVPVCVWEDHFGGCLVGRMGTFHAELTNESYANRTSVFASAGPEAVVSFPLGSQLRLEGLVEFNVAITRVSIERDTSVLWHSSRAYMTAGLGLRGLGSL